MVLHFRGANIHPNFQSFIGSVRAGDGTADVLDNWTDAYTDHEPRLFPRFMARYDTGFHWCERLTSPFFGSPSFSEQVDETFYAHMKYCKSDPFLNMSPEFAEAVQKRLTVGPPLDEDLSKCLKRWRLQTVWKEGASATNSEVRRDRRLMPSQTLRVGIVGCGAVTQRAHLPVCTATPGIKITALVDPNIGRAEQLAKEFGVGQARADTSNLRSSIDAAILAAPHALHARIGVELLRQGIHLLVEKPMALSSVECDSMIEAAGQAGAVLAVGLMRRFAPWNQYVKKVLDAGVLGTIRSFEIREGTRYNWPVASDFFFKKEAAGGGVLIDTGAHTLDTVLHWFGDPERVEYFDDAQGGVEADCEVRLLMKDGCIGTVELSRTRNLGFRYRIHGERGTLEVDSYGSRCKLTFGGYGLEGVPCNLSDPEDDGEYLRTMAASLHNWRDAILNNVPPTVTGHEGRRSISLIETCYRLRQPLVYPWLNKSNLTGGKL